MDDIFDDLFGKAITIPKTDPNTLVTHRSVWPAPEVIHNNKKTTAKYDLSGFIFSTTRCRDTIRLDVRQPSETILSVKCEKKDVNGFMATVFDYYLGFLNPFYKRDHGREQMLMVNTTQRLQTAHQAQIEWLGKWRPDPNSL